MQGWTEEHSQHFIDLGRIYTPRRDEIAGAFVDLVPANDDDAFTGVEIGTGQGWLTAAILERYPNAKMIGLDGSEAMLAATVEATAAYGNRFEGRLFRLEDPDWIDELPDDLQCIVSSLVIHHLDGPGKQGLFRALFAKLAPGAGDSPGSGEVAQSAERGHLPRPGGGGPQARRGFVDQRRDGTSG